MKKFISAVITVTIAVLSALSLSSCNTDENKITNDPSKVNVVSTIFPYYDFARNIVGDKANLTLLLPPGSEVHSFAPSPSDIVAIENCDIFIYNGGESDEWVKNVLSSVQNKKMKVLKMMDYVTPLFEEEVSHEHDEHSHEHSHSEDENTSEHNKEESDHSHDEEEAYDEHIWTSPKNAQLLSQSIGTALAEVDPKNKKYYETNTKNYIEKLNILDKEFQTIIDNRVRNTVVFGDRFPFLYFVTEYNLEYDCAFPGCSSETEPSIATVTHMIDFTKEHKIPVVFYIEFSNGKVAKLISEDTNAKTMQFSSCHNVTKDDFNNGVTYISLMEQNAKALKEALS